MKVHPGFPDMFCSLIKKTLELRAQQHLSENSVDYSNATTAVRNGSLTFPPKRNGMS